MLLLLKMFSTYLNGLMLECNVYKLLDIELNKETFVPRCLFYQPFLLTFLLNSNALLPAYALVLRGLKCVGHLA